MKDNRKAAVPVGTFVRSGSKTATAASPVSARYRLSNGKGDLVYQSIEDSLDSLYRNTIIPDKTFGPDEERIFIDVDPYDLDDPVFGLQHGDDNVMSTPVALASASNKLTAKPDIDYIEESLKNVKRYWQESRDESRDGSRSQWSTTPKDHVRNGVVVAESATSPGNAGMDVYYVEDSSTKKGSPEERRSFVDDGDKSINHGAYGNARAEDSSTVSISTLMARNQEGHRSRIPESARRGLAHANRTIDYSDAFDEESDKRKIDRHMENRTTDYTIMRFPAATRGLDGGAGQGSTLMDDRGSTVVEEEEPDEDAGNLSRNREDHAGSMEKASSVNLKEVSKEEEQSTVGDKPANVLTSTAVDNTTKNPAAESLAVLGKTLCDYVYTASLSPDGFSSSSMIKRKTYNAAVDSTESLVFEWVTTDWSKCSQTCGGSGFQVRSIFSHRHRLLGILRARVISKVHLGQNVCKTIICHCCAELPEKRLKL